MYSIRRDLVLLNVLLFLFYIRDLISFDIYEKMKEIEDRVNEVKIRISENFDGRASQSLVDYLAMLWFDCFFL